MHAVHAVRTGCRERMVCVGPGAGRGENEKQKKM